MANKKRKYHHGNRPDLRKSDDYLDRYLRYAAREEIEFQDLERSVNITVMQKD